MKVLVIDDDKVVRDFLGRFFNLKGLGADVVESGADAIEALKKINYQIVFIEIKMPVMDGLETLIELKKIKPDIRYIMMTGDYTDARIEGARAAGAEICMKKPFDLAELSGVIAEFI